MVQSENRVRPERRTERPRSHRAALAEVLRGATYEVLPFASTEAQVLAHVPVEVGLTVTTTEARGSTEPSSWPSG